MTISINAEGKGTLIETLDGIDTGLVPYVSKEEFPYAASAFITFGGETQLAFADWLNETFSPIDYSKRIRTNKDNQYSYTCFYTFEGAHYHIYFRNESDYALFTLTWG